MSTNLLDELERRMSYQEGADVYVGSLMTQSELRKLIAVARAAQVVDRDICRLEDDEYLVAPEAADLLSAALAQLEGA